MKTTSNHFKLKEIHTKFKKNGVLLLRQTYDTRPRLNCFNLARKSWSESARLGNQKTGPVELF